MNINLALFPPTNGSSHIVYSAYQNRPTKNVYKLYKCLLNNDLNNIYKFAYLKFENKEKLFKSQHF